MGSEPSGYSAPPSKLSTSRAYPPKPPGIRLRDAPSGLEDPSIRVLVFGCRFKTGVIGTALADGSFATTKKIANLFIYFPLPLTPDFQFIP
jgi:hypothetical protein